MTTHDAPWSPDMPAVRGGQRAAAQALVCLAACGCTGVLAAALQVDVVDESGRPVGGAVAFLESSAASALTKPLARVEVAQEAKQFLPGVVVVPVGTQVHFPNRDSVRHHVYSFSPAKKFELKLYTGTPANPVLFDQAGVVTLGCNIHDRMVGWIVVVDTPYYAQAPEGAAQVRIDGVPAGSYKLRVWHPRLAPGAAAHEQPVALPATGSVRAAVKLVGLAP